jgi:hypothetical protein
MTVTLNLPPEKEAAFTALALARGLSLEQWMLDFADQYIQPVSVAHLQKTNPEEWARYFDTWADSHIPNTATAPAAGSAPDLPILHLGAMGAFHRRDIYDDAC